MRNNFKKIILILFLNLGLFIPLLAADIGEAELEILDSGNIFNGINGGSVTTNDGIEIISENFRYNKSENKLEAFGNVKIIDNKNDIIINSNKIIYLKNEEKIFTKFKTKVNVKKSNYADILKLNFSA